MGKAVVLVIFIGLCLSSIVDAQTYPPAEGFMRKIVMPATEEWRFPLSGDRIAAASTTNGDAVGWTEVYNEGGFCCQTRLAFFESAGEPGGVLTFPYGYAIDLVTDRNDALYMTNSNFVILNERLALNKIVGQNVQYYTEFGTLNHMYDSFDTIDTVIDGRGVLHVAANVIWYNSVPKHFGDIGIKYVRLNKDTGQVLFERDFQPPINQNIAIDRISITADNNGNAYIVYHYVKFSPPPRNDPQNGWHIMKLDPQGTVVYDRILLADDYDPYQGTSDLILDSNNQLHVVFTGSPNTYYFDLWYAKVDANTGQLLTPVTSLTPGSNLNLESDVTALLKGETIIVYFISNTYNGDSTLNYLVLNARTGAVIIPPRSITDPLQSSISSLSSTINKRTIEPHVAVGEDALNSIQSINEYINYPTFTVPGHINMRPGQRATLTLLDTMHPGSSYMIRAAFSTYSGVPGLSRLDLDPLFFMSSSLFMPNGGVGFLDQSGRATVTITLPQNTPPGLIFYVGYTTFANSRIEGVSTPKAIIVN